MKVVSVSCPNCGARLDASEGAGQVSCSYCGTVSRVQQRTAFLELPVRIAHDPQNRPIAVQHHTTRWGPSLAGMVIVFVVLGGGVGYSIFKARQMAGLAAGSGASHMTWEGTGAGLLVDIDGDGSSEIIGRTRYAIGRDSVTISAFDGRTGALKWEGPSLGKYTDTYSEHLVVARNQLVFGDKMGRVHVFGLTDGAAVFDLAIGERAEEFCLREGDDKLYVRRADEKWVSIDLAQRRLADASAPLNCDSLRPDNSKEDSPYTWSDRSYSRVQSPPEIEGMEVSAVLGADHEIAVGFKSPGTRVPMIARVEGEKKVWGVEVPDGMNAQQGAPLLAGMNGSHVYLVYERSDGQHLVTGFDAKTGEVSFTAQVPPDGNSNAIFTKIFLTDDTVYISLWGRLEAFDGHKGARLFRIGGYF